jgi:hypothetical protein
MVESLISVETLLSSMRLDIEMFMNKKDKYVAKFSKVALGFGTVI